MPSIPFPFEDKSQILLGVFLSRVQQVLVAWMSTFIKLDMVRRYQNRVSVISLCSLKLRTHQIEFKELTAKKTDYWVALRLLFLGQKDALEHTAKTTSNGQLACTFCACLRGNNSPYQREASVTSFQMAMSL